MAETDASGLEARYEVHKIDDPIGKHDDCRYFVLDPQHDPIAVMALRYYAMRTPHRGLGRDLHDWLDSLNTSPVATVELPGRVIAGGCCDACGGNGAAHDGPCWTCQGTGHPHAPDPRCAATTPPAPESATEGAGPVTPNCGCPDARYDLHVEGGCSWMDEPSATEASACVEGGGSRG